MSIEQLRSSDMGALQYCTRCGLIFAVARWAYEHGERCGIKEAKP